MPCFVAGWMEQLTWCPASTASLVMLWRLAWASLSMPSSKVACSGLQCYRRWQLASLTACGSRGHNRRACSAALAVYMPLRAAPEDTAQMALHLTSCTSMVGPLGNMIQGSNPRGWGRLCRLA